MNKKLYYKNPYIKEFTTNIVKMVEKNNEFHLVLEQTAFYPEGGGQPCDLGTIDEIPVKYVYEEGENIYHIVEKLPSKLNNVKCKIDWDRRFDHMQQHLGQHILSAAFEKLYDADTIGFHLGKEYVTIDLNQSFSEKDIYNVELLSNQIVFNNLLVEALYPTQEELKNMPLRKEPTVTDNIRIIKINDFDYSPCGGTHPSRTGEVGLIKIRKWENYKEGTRIEFICGNRALKDYQLKNKIINKASALLSLKDIDVLMGIERLLEENHNIKKEIKEITDELLEYKAEFLINNSERLKDIHVISKIFDGEDMANLRKMASAITSKAPAVIAFGNIIQDKAQIVLSCSNTLNFLNMKTIFAKIIPLIEGKGGGNKYNAQGGGKNIDELRNSIEIALNLIKKEIMDNR